MKTYQQDYTAYQTYALLDFNISFEKDIPAGDISRTVIEVTERIDINKFVDFTHRNSHGYDGLMMLRLLLLAFADNGYASTRKLAELCRTDIRYMFIAQNQKPSHQAFQRFIHDDLIMPVEEIFYEMNRIMEDELPIDTDVLCIDGTKYEANANKNTFIWRKNTVRHRERQWKKCNDTIKRINKFFKEQNINCRYSILREPNIDYLLRVTDKIEIYMKDNGIEFVHGKGCRKSEIQKLYDELAKEAMKLFEYALHFDMLGDRNSCSKTDPDATFMHMKYDYYNHTNVFKPGYNVQVGVSDGFIRNIYVSSDCSDIQIYIPFMEKYKVMYGKLPLKTPADAGYGSYDNYMYCRENGIELFMKYPGYYEESKKTNDKNRFRASHFERTEDGGYICPAGHEFEVDKVTTDTRGVYERHNIKLINRHCDGCPFRSRCTKSRIGRSINYCKELDKFHKEVRKNVTSEEGKKLMFKRDNEAEGTFGDLKENMGYDRLYRRGHDNVQMEIYLVAMGHNIRKYQKLKKRIKETEEKQMKQVREMLRLFIC